MAENPLFICGTYDVITIQSLTGQLCTYDMVVVWHSNDILVSDRQCSCSNLGLVRTVSVCNQPPRSTQLSQLCYTLQ